ncbi:hypothetical protein BH23ACT9_BH23ACT9_16290 [soil metagenome]
MEQQGCRRCATDLLPGARYCTACGSPVAGVAAAGAAPAAGPIAQGGSAEAGEAAVPLVECETCGAGNAASRPLCARCGSPLRDEVPGGDALPEPGTGDPGSVVTAPRVRESSSVLLSLVLLAGLLTAGVLLALVTSRVTAPESEGVPSGLRLNSAVASSSLPDHPPSMAIDGDPATAWTEAAEGPGTEEWIEVVLEQPASILRVLIWNGDQRDDVRFSENGRASAVRLEIADRQFRVALRDITGPQAIELTEPVTARSVRIVIEDATPGSRYNDLAISEIVIEGQR